jgi:hypothetical protein
MEHYQNLVTRYAMILDTEAIKGVIAHAANLNLPRRECHPLDRYRGKCANVALAKYDAEVDVAPLANEELGIVDAVLEAADAHAPEHADFADEDF